MQPVKRTALAEEVARTIRTEVAEGRLGKRLPGARVLAETLGVSTPTVAAALARLAAEGVLTGGGERRAYQAVAALPPGTRPAPCGSQGRLLFVTPAGNGLPVQAEMSVLWALAPGLANRGWQLHHRMLNYGHSERRMTQWEKVLQAGAPDAVVVWAGRQPVAEWLAAKQIPSLFIGGSRGSEPVAMLAMRFPDMIGKALDELLKQGHQRFWLPLCNRPPAFVERVREVMARRLGETGCEGLAAHYTPDSAYEGGAVIEAMLAKAWREYRPTALLLADWREYVAAACFLRDQRVEIPERVSVVVMDDDIAASWHRPEMTRFRMPSGRFAAEIRKWAMAGKTGRWTGSRYLQAEWVPGETLGRA